MPRHSPATAISQVRDSLTIAGDKKLLTAVILLDQKAAFDLVDHVTLVDKIVEYGFSDTMVNWLRSYLADRRYVVQVGVTWSHPKQIGKQGVPQGSVLGSLLFILSQGDLPDVTLYHPQPGWEGPEDDPTTMYVDDTLAVVTSP